jgi:hypothetical protein
MQNIVTPNFSHKPVDLPNDVTMLHNVKTAEQRRQFTENHTRNIAEVHGGGSK